MGKAANSAPARSTDVIRPPLFALLRAAGDGGAGGEFDELSVDTAHWAIEGGLGPLLRELTPATSALTRSPAWPAVIGADLTARMQSAAQLDALEQIVEACAKRLPPLTLLKGISSCTAHYAAPHLRPMGDVDILVEPECIADADRIVRELGYEPRRSSTDYRDHHHLAPLVHPETDVWIELHHALFPRRTALGSDAVFSAASVLAERRPGSFRGRRVYHLSPELQLVYVPAHWGQSLKLLVGPAGLRSMLDTMLILRRAPSLRWPTILEWLDGAVATGPVYLMLAYLDARGLATLDPQILEAIRRRQRAFGIAGTRVAFRLLDRYIFEARPPGRLAGDRVLALMWTGLLQHGGSWRKVLAMTSRLRDSAARRWRPPVPAR
jgi:hypothetical protein